MTGGTQHHRLRLPVPRLILPLVRQLQVHAVRCPLLIERMWLVGVIELAGIGQATLLTLEADLLQALPPHHIPHRFGRVELAIAHAHPLPDAPHTSTTPCPRYHLAAG